jgi:hypothetical protein
MIDRGRTDVDAAVERVLGRRELAAPAAPDKDMQPALARTSDRRATALALRPGNTPRWLRRLIILAPSVDTNPPQWQALRNFRSVTDIGAAAHGRGTRKAT